MPPLQPARLRKRPDLPGEQAPALGRHLDQLADAFTIWIVQWVGAELRSDFQHLRRWRKSVEQAQSYTFKAVITVIVAGFVDAHLHLVALARRAGEVDCSKDRARSVRDVVATIREAAARSAPASWIRAFGYDEFFLEEKRPPTVAELDAAAPGHPVRLLHRTGHAVVLNSLGFRRLGLTPREVIHEPAGLLKSKVAAIDDDWSGLRVVWRRERRSGPVPR